MVMPICRECRGPVSIESGAPNDPTMHARCLPFSIRRQQREREAAVTVQRSWLGRKLSWLFAGPELRELERRRIFHGEARRWMAEFVDVAAVLDHGEQVARGSEAIALDRLRERLRRAAGRDPYTGDPLRTDHVPPGMSRPYDELSPDQSRHPGDPPARGLPVVPREAPPMPTVKPPRPQPFGDSVCTWPMCTCARARVDCPRGRFVPPGSLEER